MDLSGLRHSSNIVSSHQSEYFGAQHLFLIVQVWYLVFSILLKRILKCSEHLSPLMYSTSAVDIQGLIKILFAAFAAYP